MSNEFVLFEKIQNVGLITLNRPEVLNALSEGLVKDLNKALETCEADQEIHCVILMGSEKAFVAGGDIKEFQPLSYMDAYLQDIVTRDWEKLSQFRKPIIAAVSGYALGGGCELAMMCDIIIASDTAKFGQPEVMIGTIPGSGGTQRLVRAIGKSKAMEMCLSGRMMDAQEAENLGLVSRVVPYDKLKEEALTLAHKIASYSLPILMMIKEAINYSFETPLSAGIKFERRLFHSTFALEDQKEGMSAFLEKRKPAFKGK